MFKLSENGNSEIMVQPNAKRSLEYNFNENVSI